jgi:hypothetical protein
LIVRGKDPRPPAISFFAGVYRLVIEDVMSLQLSAKTATRVTPATIEEPWASPRGGRARAETADAPSTFGVVCRDVIDEVRHRMATRGFQWE